MAHRVAALWREAAGLSTIEFALTAPLMLGLLVPVVDLGMAFYQQMQVSDAAAAGAQYVIQNARSLIQNGLNPNLTAIENAVTNATTLPGVSASPAPSESCGCPNDSGTGVVLSASPTPPNCHNSTCTNGSAMGTYVTVSARATYTPVVSYPVVGTTRTLTAQSMVRIQ